MPLYQFYCETCGIFEKFRPMSESDAPMNCPSCEAVAKRSYAIAGLIATPSALSRRIDRSAEPRILHCDRTHEPGNHTHHHQHHHGRPWMVGH